MHFISIISFKSTKIILEVTISIAYNLFKVTFTSTDKLSSNKLNQQEHEKHSKAEINENLIRNVFKLKYSHSNFEQLLAHAN